MGIKLKELKAVLKKEDAASDAKARADFFKRGGKITKLPPGRAQGSTGTDTHWASGVKGLVTTKGLNLKKHGKHLDTSTPVHKEIEKNEAADKLRGPTRIAYAPNPIHLKNIGKMTKDPKYKGNTSGLMRAVKAKYPELHNHKAVQKAYQDHAETNESVIKFRKPEGWNRLTPRSPTEPMRKSKPNKKKQSDWERFQDVMKKSDEKHAAIKKKYQDNARNTALSKGAEFKPSPATESVSLKSFDEIRKQYSPQKHEWGTDASTKHAKSMTPGEKVEATGISRKKLSDYMLGASDARKHRELRDKGQGHKVDNRYSGVAKASKHLDDYNSGTGTVKTHRDAIKGKISKKGVPAASFNISNEDAQEDEHLKNAQKAYDKYSGVLGGIFKKHGFKRPTKDTQNRQKPSQRINDIKDRLRSESVDEAMNFEVEIEGLPKMFMYGQGPGQVKAQLRKIVKQPSMILGVNRVTDATVKKTFRLKAQGRDEESMDDNQE